MKLFIHAALLSFCLLPIPATTKAQSLIKVNAPAPALTLRSVLQAPTGTMGTWGDLTGRAVVLEFWATWCGGCVDNIPHLNELAEKYSAGSVQFLSITDETDIDMVKRFLERHPIHGWIGFDKDASTFQRYGIEGRPRTVLISRNGIVRAVTNPISVTLQVLDDLLLDKPLDFPESPTAPLLGLEAGAPAPLVQVLVRPAAPTTISKTSPGGVVETPGRYDAYGETLRQILSEAYDIPESRIEVPDWCGQTRYDLSVITPQHLETRRWQLVTQTLQTAFNMSAHKEMRKTAVYVLKQAEGREPNLKPTSAAGHSVHWSAQDGVLEAMGITPGTIVNVVHLLLDSEVVNETGLTNRYDFELKWNPKDPASVIQSIRQQLGLAVVLEHRNLEHLVVDSIQQPVTW